MSVTKKSWLQAICKARAAREERSEQEGTSLSARIFKESEVGVKRTQRNVKIRIEIQLVEVTQRSTVPWKKSKKLLKKGQSRQDFLFLLKSE